MSGSTAADESHETNAFVNQVTKHLLATKQRLEEIRQHQHTEEVCQQNTEFIHSGWPEKQTITEVIKPYPSVAAELLGKIMMAINTSPGVKKEAGR